MSSRVGDTEAGFSVELDEATRTVTVRGWGFWNADVALAFATAVLGACRRGRATGLVFETSELRPQREEGQEAIATMLAGLGLAGVARVSVVTRNPLTRLQILRIVKERNLKDLVQLS
ncbi:MAG: hypothetical protein IT378_01555 [Sandaracinaceae bacterium]|nr:hypothetical protein [Sandaracinaceae bacterium]